ncbi:MAG: NUDIX hydrolase [Lachnospiraceae bacterium]|nr:NUDIX hydrolase [Lachnospiraceae bacterium]
MDHFSMARNEETENAGQERDLVWQEISREHIIQDEWIDFRRSKYRFPDGSVFEPYYSYSRRDYVVIVASDEEGRFICVRQFRQGIEEVTTEFPAGGIERAEKREYRTKDADDLASGDAAGGEDPLEAAKRELQEETGYISDKWTHLLTIPSNATIADNYAHLYLAEKCRKVSSQNLDETEFLQVLKYSFDEIEGMIHSGSFQQAVHTLAWMMAKERMEKSS